jgi:hypothetical protein
MALRREWLAILLIPGIAGLIGLWRGGHVERDELDNSIQPDANDVYEFDRFKLTEVEKTVSRDNRITAALSADQVLHRNRQSGSIIFYNLNEIYIVNLSLNWDASGEPPLQALFSDVPFLSSLGNELSSVNKKEKRSAGGSVEQDKKEKRLAGGSVEQDMVTRIVADGFKIKVAFDAGRVAAISSDTATLTIQDQNIVFEGDVVVEDSEGRRLSAPQAIWSKRQEGILFPQGYSEQESNRNKEQGIAFFELDHDGALTKIEKIPAIQLHQDLVDQLENLLWAHLFQKLFGGFQ